MATNGRRPVPVERLNLKIKTLLNAHLKDILRQEGLPVSGIKQELVNRLQAHIQFLANQGDSYKISRIQAIAERNQASPSSPSNYTSAASNSAVSNTSPSYVPRSNSSSSFGSFPNMPPRPGLPPGPIRFKPSPFYTVDQTLVSNRELKVRENTRDAIEIEVNLSSSVASALQNDQSMRVFVFCAGDSGLSPYTSSDIAFPHQCELSCNLDEVKANLRGLKNKPGSTRPADITSYLRKKPGYSNKLSITYALTTKKYYIVINLVKKHSVEDLVQKIKAGKYISKESVLKEMRGKAEDADIVAMSSVMSLKCPLSTLRLDVPTRSMHCTHNQCFDAASFLQLQEQAPTWTCPICNKSTPYDSLTMDMYVDDILKSTGRNVEQVTVEPDGRWTKNAGPETPDNSRPSASEEEEDDDDDDDDIVEIQDVRVSSIKQESTPTTSTPTHQTPPYSSREHSVASSAARHPSSAAKRPASAVIDLTESDDEDAIRPPAKRPLPSGLGGLSRFGESPVSFQLPRVGGLAGSQQQQGQSHSNNSGSGSGSSYRPSPSANGQYFNTSL